MTDNFEVMVKTEIEGTELRMHLLVNAANAFDFSIPREGALLDDAVEQLCAVAPAIANVDAALAEMYDGYLDSRPKVRDIEKIRAFKRWLHEHRITLRTDGDYFEELSS